MSALEGEVLGPAPAAGLPDVPKGYTWTVHSVELPTGGRIEGMDRDDAIRLAAMLGTRAWAAEAELKRNGLVVAQVPTRIR